MSSYTITRWISAATLFALGACADDAVHNPHDDASSTELAQAVGSKSGGARNTPVDYNDPDLKCYRFTAFQSAAAKTTPYNAPTTPDFYVSFNVKAPWSGVQYIKSFKSIIDNKQVIHHWLLYRQVTAGGVEGVVPNQSGLHPDADLMFGWAPGGSDLWFDPDVGMEVPGGTMLVLENHYNNRSGGPASDASGTEVCVTPHKPAHVAALSFVGSDLITGTSASGTCTPSSGTPAHLFMSFPHMHTKGIHMKVDWIKANGQRQVIHDEPFDFNYQHTYIYDGIVVNSGDKLVTTCTYNAPAKFGKGTNDEMCYFFAIHWPAGALSRNSLFSALHGPNTCMD